MRTIKAGDVRDAVSRAAIDANLRLRPDIKKAIKAAMRREPGRRAKNILAVLLENAEIAAREKRPLCQDTGLPVVYAELGENARVEGGIYAAVKKGIEDGYCKGRFRKSVVAEPVSRKGRPSYGPPVVHLLQLKGSSLRITVAPKGFGSENKSRIKMLNPTASEDDIKRFVVDTVKSAGPDACPPYIIGVGIGGTFEEAAALSKKALLRPLGKQHPKPGVKKMERGLMEAVNRLGVGPAGLGGRTTCLGVNILTAPTHIAGLPVAVNVSCHATRSKTVTV